MNRREFLHLAAGMAVVAPAVWLPVAAVQSTVIPLRARKFEFEPNEIVVPANTAATLAITSTDFVHGFSIPDFGVRVDLIPGKTIEVSIQPQRAGRHNFLCDNFCGEGHDQMIGVLTVTDR